MPLAAGHILKARNAMPEVRAKFTVTRVEKHTYSSSYESHKVILAPCYDPELPEDQRFAKASPSGELWMQVDNPAALEQLTPGRVFYLDFTAVE
jgi:hypothetical protein